jgi:hypothetical protein
VKTTVHDLQPHIKEFAEDKSVHVFKVAKELQEHALKTVETTQKVIDDAYKEVEKEYAADGATAEDGEHEEEHDGHH